MKHQVGDTVYFQSDLLLSPNSEWYPARVLRCAGMGPSWLYTIQYNDLTFLRLQFELRSPTEYACSQLML